MAKCVEGHTAVIFDRGGMRRIDQLLDLSRVKWERDRDGVSEASVWIEADSCAKQADLIRSLRTHRHELVIYRGAQRVWEGPLHRIGDNGRRVEIVAKDVLAYLFAQPLTQKWSSAYPNVQTVTGRIGEIIEWELTHGRTQHYFDEETDTWVPVSVPAWEAIDPPVNIVDHLDIRHFPNEAETAAITYPYEMTVGEHLQGLARQQGIDFTAVGRRIVVWDVSRYLGRLQTMTEANFNANVVVSEYGADHAQAAYVIGDEGTWGQAINPENLDYYGPWTTIYTPYNENGTAAPSQAALNSQAMRNLAGRSPAPIEVRIPDNSTIILSDAVGINDLVPGVQIPLLATLNARSMDQMQKIDHVTVTEAGGQAETIQVTLTPATRPDFDPEEP